VEVSFLVHSTTNTLVARSSKSAWKARRLSPRPRRRAWEGDGARAGTIHAHRREIVCSPDHVARGGEAMDLTQFGDAAEQWRGQLRGSGVIGSPAGVLLQDQASTPFGESPKHRDRACVHAVQRRREHWGVQVADCPPAWPALLVPPRTAPDTRTSALSRPTHTDTKAVTLFRSPAQRTGATAGLTIPCGFAYPPPPMLFLDLRGNYVLLGCCGWWTVTRPPMQEKL